MKRLLPIVTLVFAITACNQKPMKQQAAVRSGTEEIAVAQAVPQSMIDVTGPTVVDFYATWCGPCKQLAPIIEALEAKYAGRVRFLRIDVDENPNMAQYFQIESIPTLLFITTEGVVDATIGLSTQGELDWQIQSKLLGNQKN